MRSLHIWTLAATVLSGVIAVSNTTQSSHSQQILSSNFKPPQVFENVNLIRTTNLEKGYVRETVNLVIQNVDPKPQDEYYLPFEYDIVAKIGGIEAKDKKNVNKPPFNVRLAGMTSVVGEDGTTSK